MRFPSTGGEDLLEEEMATHSSILTWRIPRTEEPGGLVHGVAEGRTQQSDFTFTFHFRALEKEMALQCSCLENSRDGGAWWAAVYGVAQSRTRLKRLSSSRLDLLSVQGTLKNLLEHHSSKASILLCSYFFIVQLLVVHTHIFTLF